MRRQIKTRVLPEALPSYFLFGKKIIACTLWDFTSKFNVDHLDLGTLLRMRSTDCVETDTGGSHASCVQGLNELIKGLSLLKM